MAKPAKKTKPKSAALSSPRFSKPALIIFILIFATIGGYTIYRSFAVNTSNPPGDTNNDNTVNLTDLTNLLANWHTNNSSCDFNNDGIVDGLDLSILLSNYGQSVAVKPFLASSAINQPIPTNPAIHPDTTAMIQNDPAWVLQPGDPNYSVAKEWLGPRQRTVYKQTPAGTATTAVHVNYSDALGYGCDRSIVNVPMTPDVFSLLSLTAGPVDHDTPTWLVDTNGNAYEGFDITPPGTALRYASALPGGVSCSTNQWNAERVDYWGPGSVSNEKTGVGYGTGHGISASHIQAGAGLIRPEDLQKPPGSNFGHALRIDSCAGADGNYTSGPNGGHPRSVSPAASGDGVNPGVAGIPYGARIQFDPSINVDDPANPYGIKAEWQRMILRTLQVYGAILVDHSCPNGSGGLEAADSYTSLPYVFPWEADGSGWGYNNGIPFTLMSHFRVIDWRVWTGS